MKNVVIMSVLVCLTVTLKAQTDPIDEMFDKYSEREGFTTVYISSKLLGLFVGKDPGGESDIINRLKSIRILSVDDSLLNNTVNFYKELNNKVNLSAYEELMVVRNSNDVTKFLIRQKGEIITELLVIAGGPSDNTLISIKGDLDLRTISELSRNSGIDKLKDLENVERKHQDE